ncbi:hypothetical protein [Roseomonas sp. WA12]
MTAASSRSDGVLADGSRIGRFLVVRDVDGRRHALAASAVIAVSETEDSDTLLLLPGGRALRLCVSLPQLLAWLDGRG